MRRTTATLSLVLTIGAALLAGTGTAHAATATSESLLGGLAVESWGACEMPDGWVFVHHDGRTSAGVATGMRLFQGSDASATVVRAWPRTSPSGRVPDRHHCVSADFDHNGLTDFYVTAGRGGNNGTKENGRGNELWLQMSEGVFENRAAAWGVEDVCGRSHYAATADFNGDGWNDLFVGNAVPRAVTPDPCDAQPGSELAHLYLSSEGTGFVDATSAWGLSVNGGARCVQAGQFLGDPAPDLVVCRSTGLLVLENVPGQGFVDRRASLGLPATDWRQAAVGDVTRDGVPDLVAATGTAVRVWSSMRGTPRVVLSSTALRGVALNPAGDIYALRSATTTNPQDVVMVRNTTGWSPAWVPNAGGSGDFAVWLEGPDAWLVGNGLNDRLGPMQLVQAE